MWGTVIDGSRSWPTLNSPGVTDELDALRAILCAFSHRVGGSCTPVSIVSIQHELRRRNRNPQIAARLHEIAEVRDVQDVGRGFWLPVPTHAVRLNGASLVVSGLPNQELTRRFGVTPFGNGVSRVVRESADGPQGIPHSALREWIGAPASTADWTLLWIESTNRHAPFGLEGAELYLSWIERTPRRWGPMCDNIPNRDGTYMGRIRSTDSRPSYFLTRLVNRRATSLQEVPPDLDTILRLQFGLRTLHNCPNWYKTASSDSNSNETLELPLLPSAEARLLKAVGVVRSGVSGYGITAVIPEYATESVFSCVAALGLVSR